MDFIGIKLRGIKTNSYIVGEYINGGGEGSVYRIVGDSTQVLKLYHDSKMTPTQYVPNMREHLEKKLRIMVNYPVSCYNAQGKLSVAWPQDVVYYNNKFVGYVMPCVTTNKKIYDVCREKSRVQMFPNYTWKYAVILALNLSWTVNSIHEKGYCIGDFNPNNILIDKHGNVTLIDTDSFDIKEPKGGYNYKCMVGVPEMLAPELQGRGNLQNPRVKFTQETDNFSLAIHIFNLLMNNCHPFNCINISKEHSSSNMAPLSVDIAEGHFYYGRPLPKGIELPDTAPDYSMLPQYIRGLFERTFRYTASTAYSAAKNRATAKEWLIALEWMRKERYSICEKDQHHTYLESYGKCPWCKIEKKKRANSLTISGLNNRITNFNAAAQTANSVNSVNSTTERSVVPLYIVFVLVGLISGFLLAPVFQKMLAELDVTWKLDTLRILSVIVGLIVAPIGAHLFEENYVEADTGWPLLFTSLLVPVGITLVALAIGLVVFLVILVFYIACVIFFFFCVCTALGGS